MTKVVLFSFDIVFGWLCSEIISNLSEDKECKNIDFKRITSNAGVIPASADLEKESFIKY